MRRATCYRSTGHRGTALGVRLNDALGRRLAKASRLHRGEERLTLFGWEGDTLVWEKQGQQITHYVYEPNSFTPLMQFSHEGRGQGIEPVWYACDHLGTPLSLIDREGETVWRAEYEAYGAAQETRKGTVQTPIRFPGQYFDAETGLHYNHHRYYDPQTGRYLSKDPIGLEGGINAYGYVLQNPVSFIDHDGLKPVTKEACAALKKLIEFDDQQSNPFGVLYSLAYNALFGSELPGLNASFETIGGPDHPLYRRQEIPARNNILNGLADRNGFFVFS